MEAGYEVGTIITLNVERGFGFIRATGRDVFFHASSLADDLPFDEQLRERRVEFRAGITSKGERAENVRAAD